MRIYYKYCLFAFTGLLFSSPINAQTNQSDVQPLDAFSSTTWKCTGQWSDGTKFEQEVSYEWDIPGKIMHTVTKGNVSASEFVWGTRNSGIRMVEQGKFWEFDVFGNVTTGEMKFEGSDIYYSYAYKTENGTMDLTDGWEFQKPGSYTLKVGTRADGEWKTVLMEASCLEKKNP